MNAQSQTFMTGTRTRHVAEQLEPLSPETMRPTPGMMYSGRVERTIHVRCMQAQDGATALPPHACAVGRAAQYPP